MKWKNITMILSAILILVAIGAGVSIIYSDFLYNPYAPFDSFQVRNSTLMGYESPDILPSDTKLLKEIEQWAKEEQATVICKVRDFAGCGFCGYSPWTEQELGIENYQGNEDGVYVTDDPGFRETYVHGNILLPGTADLEIKGTYSSASVLPLLRDVDFLYPITIAASADGMYFTDAKNTERLEAIFHENGYSVVSRSQPNNITLRNLIRKLMTNGTMYIAILCAMIGLIFSFIYGIMTLYRANARKLWIHHMFGLTKGRIALGIFLLAAGIAGVAAVLFRVVLVYASSYMGESDFRSIFRGTLMFYILLSAGVHGACYFGISRQFRLRGA